jgi:hypothetical protein
LSSCDGLNPFFVLFTQVFIDENGNAEGNFSVFAIQNSNGSFSMQQVGSFVGTQNDLPTFKLNDGKDILWINGRAPAFEPNCGFDGCPHDLTFMFCFSGALLFLSIVSIFIFK